MDLRCARFSYFASTRNLSCREAFGNWFISQIQPIFAYCSNLVTYVKEQRG